MKNILLKILNLLKRRKGTFDFQNSKNLKMVRWNNNSVTLASNHHGIEPVAQAKRWSYNDKQFVEIDQPHVVSQYNKFMGGTDRMDQNLSQYRCSIRSKKWCSHFFYLA